MPDYHTIIAELSPTAEQIKEATDYAFAQITEQVLESDPFATVSFNDGGVSIGSENDDFTHAMQAEFANLFESRLKQLQADETNGIIAPDK